MRFLYILILMLCMPLFAMAEILPRTIYAVSPKQLTSETISPNEYISLYAIGDDAYAHQDIGIKSHEEIKVKIIEYIEPKRGKRDGYYKIEYNYGDIAIMGKMKVSTPKDYKDILQNTGISIVGHALKFPGFSQAIAISKGLINPDEDKSRLKTAGENLYESTPLTYAEKGKDFQVEEDGIVVIKLKVKDDCEN